MDRLTDRPCGACGQLVPTATGCRHWKPGNPTPKRSGWPRRVVKTRGLADRVGEAAMHKMRDIECTCGKKPGPPDPHAYACAKMEFIRGIDSGVRDTVE